MSSVWILVLVVVGLFALLILSQAHLVFLETDEYSKAARRIRERIRKLVDSLK